MGGRATWHGTRATERTGEGACLTLRRSGGADRRPRARHRTTLVHPDDARRLSGRIEMERRNALDERALKAVESPAVRLTATMARR
jgi:hypothetical protein